MYYRVPSSASKKTADNPKNIDLDFETDDRKDQKNKTESNIQDEIKKDNTHHRSFDNDDMQDRSAFIIKLVPAEILFIALVIILIACLFNKKY